MSDMGPRGGDEIDPEEDRDLTPDAYTATVPSRLTGFRGTNPALLVVAGAVALAIIVFSLFSFLHRGGASGTGPVAAGSAEPAAPGVGGGVAATPFVPSPVTPFPTYTRPPEGLPYLPQRTPPPQPRQIYALPRTLPPQGPLTPQNLTPQSIVAAQQRPSGGDSESLAGGKMQLEQPQTDNGAAATNPQDAQASRDLRERFVPIYRNGRVVAVVPVESERTQGSSPGTAVGQVPAPAGAAVNAGGSPESSAQFVSSTATTAPNDETAPARERRRFSQEEQARDVGNVRQESPTQIDTATVINARLLTKIESDLPGPVIAQITQPVYDSATHSILVIPAGTKVFGIYDNSVVQNQTRLLMAFRRLVFPDGHEFDIGGLPGTDALGTSGFSGDVDRHRGEFYTSAILLTVLGGAEAAITPSQNVLINGQTIASQVQSSAGAQLSNLGDKILNNVYQRPPTIIIRPPYGFNIIVTRDLALDEYQTQHP